MTNHDHHDGLALGKGFAHYHLSHHHHHNHHHPSTSIAMNSSSHHHHFLSSFSSPRNEIGTLQVPSQSIHSDEHSNHSGHRHHPCSLSFLSMSSRNSSSSSSPRETETHHHFHNKRILGMAPPTAAESRKNGCDGLFRKWICEWVTTIYMETTKSTTSTCIRDQFYCIASLKFYKLLRPS